MKNTLWEDTKTCMHKSETNLKNNVKDLLSQPAETKVQLQCT